MLAQLCPSASCSTFHRRDKLKVIMQMKRALLLLENSICTLARQFLLRPRTGAPRSILFYIYIIRAHARRLLAFSPLPCEY
jgi:hypothetical protein